MSNILDDIHLAASNGNIEIIKAILTHFPEKINARDKDYLTPLHHAVKKNHFSLVKYLIAQGANLFVHCTKQLHLVNFVKYSTTHQNPELINHLKDIMSFDKKTLKDLSHNFNTIMEKATLKAKQHNKKILIILGEIHGAYRIQQLEQEILKIAKKFNINHFLKEVINGNCVEQYATQLGMTINEVDNHVERDTANLLDRNIVISKEVKQINENSVLVVGSNHLHGLLNDKRSQLDLNQFYVVPFNLSTLIEDNDDYLEKQFSEDAERIIQIIESSFSSFNPCTFNQPATYLA